MSVSEPNDVHVVEHHRLVRGLDVAVGRGEWPGVGGGEADLDDDGVTRLDRAQQLVSEIGEGPQEDVDPRRGVGAPTGSGERCRPLLSMPR